MAIATGAITETYSTNHKNKGEKPMWMDEKRIPDFLRIDPERETREILARVKTFSDRQLEETGKKQFGVALGLSGGLDSAVVCRLVSEAFGPKNVFPCFLPGPGTSEESQIYGGDTTKQLSIPMGNCWISVISEETVKKTLYAEGPFTDLQFGNAMARIRMIRLRYRVALQETRYPENLYRLAGTENASEYWTGFFTVGGDQSSDFEVLSGYFKTQVWQIARYLGIDSQIVDRDPSPELGDCATDEQALPAPYYQLDRVLFYLLRLGKNAQEMKNMIRVNGVENLVSLVTPNLRGLVDEEVIERVIVWVKARLGKIEIPYLLGESRLFQD